MHEYFAISVHFVVFYTVFNQKPWHFATFSRKKHTLQELCSIDDCLDENNNQTDYFLFFECATFLAAGKKGKK